MHSQQNIKKKKATEKWFSNFILHHIREATRENVFAAITRKNKKEQNRLSLLVPLILDQY